LPGDPGGLVFTANPILLTERVDQAEKVGVVQLAHVRLVALGQTAHLHVADMLGGQVLTHLAATPTLIIQQLYRSHCACTPRAGLISTSIHSASLLSRLAIFRLYTCSYFI
jgi:hypothetical protein